MRTAVDFTLKSSWAFDTKRRAFVSESGKTFSPLSDLPKGSRIVYKVPQLARADAATLSVAQRALRRHMQVILPPGEPVAKYLRAVRAWPAVEKAEMSPQVSLPRTM